MHAKLWLYVEFWALIGLMVAVFAALLAPAIF